MATRARNRRKDADETTETATDLSQDLAVEFGSAAENINTADAVEAEVPTDSDTPVSVPENEDEVTVTEEAPVTTAVADETDEKPDTSGLHAALDAILAGPLPEDQESADFSTVIAAYGALSRKGKSAATRELNDASRTSLESGDFDKARVILWAERATKNTKPKSERVARVSDPTTPFVNKLAAFSLAYKHLAATAAVEGSGIAEDWNARYEAQFAASEPELVTLLEWQDAGAQGEAPEVSEAAKLAARIAFKSVRKPYGARHDVTKHIEQVFAALPEGSALSVGEIAAADSEEYGDDHPSNSAINSRIKAITENDKPLPEGLSVIDDGGVRKISK